MGIIVRVFKSALSVLVLFLVSSCAINVSDNKDSDSAACTYNWPTEPIKDPKHIEKGKFNIIVSTGPDNVIVIFDGRLIGHYQDGTSDTKWIDNKGHLIAQEIEWRQIAPFTVPVSYIFNHPVTI